MADMIERLYKLTVDGTAAARSLGEIERATASLDKRFAAVAAGAKAFGAALAGVVSAGAIVAGIKQIIDGFDQLADDAQRLGVAVEELQQLRYVAQFSGLSVEQLDKAIGKLSVGMFDLADGTDNTSKALRALGARSGEDVTATLKRLADQFQKMPDGIQKTALAIKIFGDELGPKLIPLLNGGAAGIKELTDEAERFGGVVSGKVVDQAAAFNDNLDRLTRTVAGVGAQLTAGLLPALMTVSQALVDSAKSGDGFVGVGKAIGETLANVTGWAIKAGATLQAVWILAQAGRDVLASTSPIDAGTIFSKAIDDVNALEAVTNTKLAKLRADFKQFTADAENVGPADKPKPGGPRIQLDDGGKAAKEKLDALKKATEAQRKAEEERWKELIRLGGVEDAAAKAADDHTLVLTNQERAIMEASAAHKEYLDAIEREGARLQYLLDLTDETTEAYQTATPALRAYAAAQLKAEEVGAATTKTIVKQKDEIDVLTQGFEGFFDNLSRGAADAEELFRRMVQSILAELLKIWAARIIWQSFGISIFGGIGKAAGATGFAFDQAGVIPFARGGVISRPVTFPMALAGEAGPEAILPLRRTASGDLGVQSQAAQMQVTVNNYSTASVTTRRTGPNDLEVIIEQTRAAIAADLRSGGNPVSRSLESAYGIGRGAAAAF